MVDPVGQESANDDSNIIELLKHGAQGSSRFRRTTLVMMAIYILGYLILAYISGVHVWVFNGFPASAIPGNFLLGLFLFVGTGILLAYLLLLLPYSLKMMSRNRRIHGSLEEHGLDTCPRCLGRASDGNPDCSLCLNLEDVAGIHHFWRAFARRNSKGLGKGNLVLWRDDSRMYEYIKDRSIHGGVISLPPWWTWAEYGLGMALIALSVLLLLDLLQSRWIFPVAYPWLCFAYFFVWAKTNFGPNRYCEQGCCKQCKYPIGPEARSKHCSECGTGLDGSNVIYRYREDADGLIKRNWLFALVALSGLFLVFGT